MAAPQLGHGKEVEPVCSRGMPDDVQFVARSVMISPQEQNGPRPPLLYGCVQNHLR